MPETDFTAVGIPCLVDVWSMSTEAPGAFVPFDPAFETAFPDLELSFDFGLPAIVTGSCPEEEYNLESLGRERGRQNLAAFIRFGKLRG